MAGSFLNRARAASRASAEPFEGRAFADHSFADQQGVHLEIRVVFRVSDCAFQGLLNQDGGLFRAERQQIQRVGSGMTLDVP